MKGISTILGLRLLLAAVAAALFAACASMGRPQGGPRDVDPPVFVRGNPSPNALNVDNNKIHIEFDENVTVSDVMTKVVVSPAQSTTPSVSANGHRVTVELRDTLIPNTTYTIDFADAIKDLNEGNVIDGFSYAFSTGETIDSMQISGMVFEAATLEPAQGMLVGVYSDLSDTAITTLPMERITRTNQLGEFTLRNLKEGTYRIFAINDINRDYHWDRSEDVAFYDMTVTTTSSREMVTDTLVASDGSDSIVSHMGTVFGPNDVLLTWFNENYKAQYLQDNKRVDQYRINLMMGAPSDTLPTVRLLNGKRAGSEWRHWAVLNASPTRDSLEYWITDSLVFNQDTLLLETTYQRTDSLEQLVWTTDTLKLTVRGAKKKKDDDGAKKSGKKKKGSDEENDSATEAKIDFMRLRVSPSSNVDLYSKLTLTSEVPISDFDPEAVHLYVMMDTLWEEVKAPRFERPSELRPMLLEATYDWEPARQYRLTIDSATVYDIYGKWNNSIEQKFTTRALEDYSTVIFKIKGLDGQSAVLQLLNSSDKPVKEVVVDSTSTATVEYVNPGTYYARLFIDRNHNGLYDTGSVRDSLQPEETYYYPKKITLKKYWTWEQTWDINELPVDKQKPQEIKKNKPKKKAGEINRDEEEEEDEYDEFDNFNNSPFGDQRRGSNTNNRLNNGRNDFNRGSGFRQARRM